MSDEKIRITLSIPGEDYPLLEQVEQLVESGEYDNKSDVFRDAIAQKYGPVQGTAEAELYDAAHSAYIEAHNSGLDEIKKNAERHIMDRYGRTRMLDKIDEILEY